MRDIKFRAWDKHFHKMYYDNEALKVCHNIIFFKAMGEWKISKADCDYCQFTGLKDKNKKDIYEGDIFFISNPVTSEHNKKYEVVFKNACFVGEIKTARDWGYVNLEDWHPRLEVIGNIYENPELLNQ